MNEKYKKKTIRIKFHLVKRLLVLLENWKILVQHSSSFQIIEIRFLENAQISEK